MFQTIAMAALRRRNSSPLGRLFVPFAAPGSSAAAYADVELDERDVLWNRPYDTIPLGVVAALSGDDSRSVRLNALPSLSSSSSMRMIPVVPKKAGVEFVARSAPVNIPVASAKRRWRAGDGEKEYRKEEMVTEGEEEEDEQGEWMPPHEIVARTWEKTSMTCYSVLEGAGRTLKGRDLRRVRNAVWQQTGFLD